MKSFTPAPEATTAVVVNGALLWRRTGGFERHGNVRYAARFVGQDAPSAWALWTPLAREAHSVGIAGTGNRI